MGIVIIWSGSAGRTRPVLDVAAAEQYAQRYMAATGVREVALEGEFTGIDPDDWGLCWDGKLIITSR